MGFRKKDFKKKSVFNINYVREEYDQFSEIFIDKNTNLFKNCYSFLKDQLSEKGYDYYINLIEGIPKIIKNNFKSLIYYFQLYLLQKNKIMNYYNRTQ